MPRSGLGNRVKVVNKPSNLFLTSGLRDRLPNPNILGHQTIRKREIGKVLRDFLRGFDDMRENFSWAP